MMWRYLLGFSLAAVLASPSVAQDSAISAETKNKLAAYTDCLVNEATKLLPAKESVEATIKVSDWLCDNPHTLMNLGVLSDVRKAYPKREVDDLLSIAKFNREGLERVAINSATFRIFQLRAGIAK